MSTAARTTDEVMCPKCGGRTWDNRATKKNPKAPDYKCRDRGCDGVVWPPKNPPAATQQKHGFSAGPRIEQMDGPLDMVKLESLFALYGVCLAEAIQQSQKFSPEEVLPPSDVIAMAATIFIQAAKL